MTTGFYSRLRTKRKDDDALAACIDRVVNQLETASTDGDRPGILLGKIQSGKTRGFVGVIARAFDRGFDIALVLTKGTKTLSAQTVARLSSDFKEFIEEDELLVLDIMKLPGKLTKSELKRKIVIVAKKQDQNLGRLITLLNESLQNRRILLVDDEADLASIRFVKKKGESAINQGTIAEQIDALRRYGNEIAYLQVTATPYSLYLQPEGYDDTVNGNGYVFKPKRPAFTELLPIHGGYVGGNDYFTDFEDTDPRASLYVEVSADEHDALRKQDRRRISRSRILSNSQTVGLRRAIVTFIVSVCVRRWQQHEAGEKKRKYAMVIHNDTQKAAHSWQVEVIDWIFEELQACADNDNDALLPIFDAAFEDLRTSVTADRGLMPPKDLVFSEFLEALQSEEVVREKVNSDQDVMALLDESAELRLRTPYNIFLGGSILDRGITIPQLISFYYGRNPKTMQADTVLQHSRMYGNRDRRDLAVTRFFTSKVVYDRLYQINSFENALRGAFESGAHDRGVVFIQADDSQKVRPCAPNKLLLSDVVTVGPSDMLLPTDFTVKSGKPMITSQERLDQLIKPEWRNLEGHVEIDLSLASEIIDEIKKTMNFDSTPFEWDAMKGLIDYYSDKHETTPKKVLLIAETNRKLGKVASGNKSGRSVLGTALRERAINNVSPLPLLIVLQQEGSIQQGWSGHPFWWPVLVAPAIVEPCVFATKTAS